MSVLGSDTAAEQINSLKHMPKDPSIDPGEENSESINSEAELKASLTPEGVQDGLKRPASKRSINQPLINLAKMPSNDKLVSTSSNKIEDKKSQSKMKRETSFREFEKKQKDELGIVSGTSTKQSTRVTNATIESHRRLKEKVCSSVKEQISSNQISTTGGPSSTSLQTTTINTSLTNNKKSFKDKSMEESATLVSPKSDLEKAAGSNKRESKLEQKLSTAAIDAQEKARSISEGPKKFDRVSDTGNPHLQPELEVKDELEIAARRKKRSVATDSKVRRSGKLHSRTDKTPDASFATSQKTTANKPVESKTLVRPEESVKKTNVYESGEGVTNNSIYMKLVKNVEKTKEDNKSTAASPSTKDPVQKIKKRK